MSEEVISDALAKAAYSAASRWDTKHEPPLLLKPWADLGEQDRDCWRQVAVAVAAEIAANAATITTEGVYTGAAQHTFTTACDGFHEPGQCPRSDRQGVQVGDGNTQFSTF